VLAREGRLAFGRALAAHLAMDFDRVLLPRAWRVVEELPVDERGKRSQAALAVLFDADAPQTEPEPLGETRGPGVIERRLRVPENLAFLEGHFPDMPVVPGVVQIRWALGGAAALLGEDVTPAILERVKWKGMLRPGDEFTLRVQVEGDRLEFHVTAGERLICTGRGTLAPGREGPA
jgi:3-hydroxymyristoyl/3-hydroxydecanoyl-(acyl carrier protein) dehydratase